MTDLFGDDPVARVLAYMDRVKPERDPMALRADLNAVRRAQRSFKHGRFGKSMAGLGSLWGYFPHATAVQVNGVSVDDKLADPETRRAIAEKTWAYCQKHEGGRISFNRIRQSIKAYAGHHVSNFRPVCAKDLYEMFPGKVVFDPCAGWGGRLMGACAARMHYVGVDASRATTLGLANMVGDLHAHAAIIHAAVEDLPVEPGGYDMAFTSPPYFDAERYSADPEQSWVRYRTYPEWRDGFLGPLITRMAASVRRGGVVALNIANVKKYPLELDAVTFLDHSGLVPRMRAAYVLSSIAGKGEKTEPIFIYQKP